MSSHAHVVVGLGETGRSVARYLAAEDIPFIVGEDHPTAAAITEMKQLSNPPSILPISDVPMQSGSQWIVSPGIPLSLPQLKRAIKTGITLTNDVVLFSKRAKAPVVGITGSNGKTTVTSLVAHLARSQLSCVRVGGNIGTPCLDILDDAADCYVLELSSYHLELAQKLPLEVGVLLNLSPDHLDRYSSTDEYYHVKGNVFNDARQCVSSEDCLSLAQSRSCKEISTFGSAASRTCAGFGLVERDDATYLAQGSTLILDVRQLSIQGLSNWLNALAALAIGQRIGLDMHRMAEDLISFQGLPHRCQRIHLEDERIWVNDSKATNVGAAVAAIRSYKDMGPLVLLLGGQGKSADFSMLNIALGEVKSLKAVLIYGEVAQELKSTLDEWTNVTTFVAFGDMVEFAIAMTAPGDVILLSPACASFDQFSSYESRGDCFTAMLGEVS